MTLAWNSLSSVANKEREMAQMTLSLVPFWSFGHFSVNTVLHRFFSSHEFTKKTEILIKICKSERIIMPLR